MKPTKRTLTCVALIALVLRLTLADAAEPAGAPTIAAPTPATEGAPPAAASLPVKPPAKDLILRGDAKCTSCHDEADPPQVLGIGRTRHGVRADERTPTCTSCHGESESHVGYTGSRRPPKPDRTFRRGAPATAADLNASCLQCHQNDSKRYMWEGSAHQMHDVACSSCHRLHGANDPVRDKRAQPDVCFACHKAQRAQVNKQSHHPILEGKVSCADCHNAHGSSGPKLLKRDSVVETCYTCHMEKRGPFVHNHRPVSDDCTNCHMPHGTAADYLLKARPPLVCYQCHSGHGTPGIAGIAPGITTNAKANSNIEQGRGCLNCHTEIHGSNNPNGGDKLLPPAFFLQ